MAIWSFPLRQHIKNNALVVKLSLQHGRGRERKTNPWFVTFERDHAGIVRTLEQRRADAE
jgi:hypothetical protein